MRRLALVIAVLLVAGLAPVEARDISGSTVTFDSYVLLSPTDLQLSFIATRTSSDLEYLDRVTIRLPPAWTITSATSTDFDTTGGVGTSTATFSDSDYPCSGFGKSCSSGCVLVVHVDPNGVLDSQTVTWMLESDAYGGAPQVVCSTSDPATGADVCYTGLDNSGADIITGPVPVELQAFSVE